MSAFSFGNRGEMGPSTLIIFVAVILVAAIAAGILISSSAALQQRALKAGGEAEESVSASFSVISVVGSDGSDGYIEDLEVLMKLQAGSDPVHLNYTIISVSTGSWSQDMEYNGSGTSAFGTQSYWVEWVKAGPEQRDDYINRGDLVKVRFHAGSEVGEAKKFNIKFASKNGFLTNIGFTTPMRLRETKVNLYPMAI